MKLRITVFVFFFLLLVACGSAVTSTPSPLPPPPISSPPPEATATVLLATPTLATPTEPSATLEVTATPPPTSSPTSAMQITIVSDEQPTTVPSPGTCQHPQSWILYTVQANDTLSSLAQRTGTSWQQIQAANCLSGTIIFAGQTLYLPSFPAPMPSLPGPTVAILTPVPPGPGNPQLTVTPTAGYPGDTFTIIMDDFPRNNPIRLVIIYADAGILLVRMTLTPDANGDATYLYTSPTDAQPGNYNIYASSSAATPVVKDGEFKIIRRPIQYP